MTAPWAEELGADVLSTAQEFLDSATWESANCFCGGRQAELIALRDRYDIPVPVATCLSCGTTRSDVRPSPADLERYYRDGWFERLHPGQAIKSYQREIYECQAAITVRASGLAVGFLTEIGAGPDGGCLRYLPRSWVAGRAGAVDVVCAHHVLEHCADPVSTLREWSGMLFDGGCLVVTVPNTDDVDAHRLVRQYGIDAWWTFDHLWHWTLSTIKLPFQLAGLEPEVSLLPPGEVSHVGSLLVVARRAK
jgi:SAM-dependent methyltransferase